MRPGSILPYIDPLGALNIERVDEQLKIIQSQVNGNLTAENMSRSYRVPQTYGFAESGNIITLTGYAYGVTDVVMIGTPNFSGPSRLISVGWYIIGGGAVSRVMTLQQVLAGNQTFTINIPASPSFVDFKGRLVQSGMLAVDAYTNSVGPYPTIVWTGDAVMTGSVSLTYATIHVS